MISRRHTRFITLLSTTTTLLLSPLSVLAADEWKGQKDGVATIAGIGDVVGNLLRVVLPLVGLTTFIMIIVGGFKFLFAGGDAKTADAAKATITSGILGLVLAIMAWFVLLGIQAFTGVKVTEFNIGF